eukprot:CAMPEP_0114504630 /NCGR_PEP_ID=MMETSP0109-20121206/10372_1 /TAXON_ID=29199 /ORGANISM="Chlorarachnion reptans, Strain CCCM449" /LENGTH=202 /DNA_ID=CAMNT_0001682915 /DNA_START=75 /DNA_END=683 /DNA_ORIENTATION=+
MGSRGSKPSILVHGLPSSGGPGILKHLSSQSCKSFSSGKARGMHITETREAVFKFVAAMEADTEQQLADKIPTCSAVIFTAGDQKMSTAKDKLQKLLQNPKLNPNAPVLIIVDINSSGEISKNTRELLERSLLDGKPFSPAPSGSIETSISKNFERPMQLFAVTKSNFQTNSSVSSINSKHAAKIENALLWLRKEMQAFQNH